MNEILHICTRREWEAARQRGVYQPEGFEQEGFIHCSTAAQVLEVANRLFRGAPDLLVLRIDLSRVNAPVRWEAADGELYPHIYAPLDLQAVEAIPLQPDPDGVYRRF